MQRIFCFWLFLTLSLNTGAIAHARTGTLSDLPAAARSRVVEALAQDLPWLQLAELTASDGTYVDQLGFSVAIDGNTVVVGAPYATVGNNQGQGAAYVFVKPASGWGNMTQVAKLTALDGKALDLFGVSVAISRNTVLVGVSAQYAGSGGYLFVRPLQGWKNKTETAKLGCLGSVAISGDTAVCAGAYEALVFVRPKSGWKSTNKYDALLVTADGKKNFFSSISANGDVVVIGAAGISNESDVAYLYVKPKGGWRITDNTKRTIAQKAILTASDSHSGDYFGFSVSIHSNTVAVGAPGFNAAYVFVKPPRGWANMTQTAKLTTNTTDNTSVLGWSVAILGNTLAAGNPTGDDADNHQGEAFVYRKPPNGWTTTSTPDARLIATDGEWIDQFGGAVAISGQTILVGATHFEDMDPGAAYVFGH
jgi:hypothetical protein